MSQEMKLVYYCTKCDFKSDDDREQMNHLIALPEHDLSSDKDYWNKYPDRSDIVSDEEVSRRLKDTIEFLRNESVGGIWNSIQLIEMLEDHFKVKRRLL